jgi:hypothetical protein
LGESDIVGALVTQLDTKIKQAFLVALKQRTLSRSSTKIVLPTGHARQDEIAKVIRALDRIQPTSSNDG